METDIGAYKRKRALKQLLLAFVSFGIAALSLWSIIDPEMRTQFSNPGIPGVALLFSSTVVVVFLWKALKIIVSKSSPGTTPEETFTRYLNATVCGDLSSVLPAYVCLTLLAKEEFGTLEEFHHFHSSFRREFMSAILRKVNAASPIDKRKVESIELSSPDNTGAVKAIATVRAEVNKLRGRPEGIQQMKLEAQLTRDGEYWYMNKCYWREMTPTLEARL